MRHRWGPTYQSIQHYADRVKLYHDHSIKSQFSMVTAAQGRNFRPKIGIPSNARTEQMPQYLTAVVAYFHKRHLSSALKHVIILPYLQLGVFSMICTPGSPFLPRFSFHMALRKMSSDVAFRVWVADKTVWSSYYTPAISERFRDASW